MIKFGDKIDEKLTTLLDNNPIMPVSKIAQKLRISQQLAHFRIRRLTDNGIITKFGTIINLKALGMEHYRIFYSFHAHDRALNPEIFEYLKKHDGVYWAGRIGGRYDLTVTLFVRDFEQFDIFIDKFNKRFPGLVKNHVSCYGIQHNICKHKYLGEGREILSYGYNDAPQKTDSLDMHILQSIKDNARISALEISGKRSVSYKTIINRIKTMKSNRIILGYRIFMNDKIKQPAMLLISFRNYSLQTEKELINYLHEKNEVTQTVRLYGAWNLLIHLRIKNSEELQQFIIGIRDRFNIVDDYEIIPVFEDISINLCPIMQ